jgi:hypothetical protein
VLYTTETNTHATKQMKCWTRNLICGPYRSKENLEISSSQDIFVSLLLALTVIKHLNDIILCIFIIIFSNMYSSEIVVNPYVMSLWILPVVLHEFETWSLTLREEHRLRVFENRVLRKIFEPMR